MYEQMTIFDLMPVPDINDIPEDEAVRIVGQRIGVNFTWNPLFEEWQGHIGKMELSMNYSHFVLDDNRDLFLGVGYLFGTEAGGAPSSGIDDAVKYFKKRINKCLRMGEE